MYKKNIKRNREESRYNKNPKDNNSKTRINATIIDIKHLHNGITAVSLEYNLPNGAIYHKTLEFNKQYNLSNYSIGSKMPIWVNQKNPEDIKTALRKQFIGTKGIIKPFIVITLLSLGVFAYQYKEDIKDFFYEELTKIGNKIDSTEDEDNSIVNDNESEDIIIDNIVEEPEDTFLKKIIPKGEAFINPDLEITYLGLEPFDPDDYNILTGIPKGMIMGLVKFEIKNKSNNELRINRGSFAFFANGISAENRFIDRKRYKSVFQNPDDKILDDYLAPHSEITGYFLCTIPKDWSNFYVEYSVRNNETIAFAETKDNTDFPFITKSDTVEVELVEVKELTIKDIYLDFTDKHTAEILPKILKIKLNIKNGKDEYLNLRNFDFKTYLDGATTNSLRKSVLNQNEGMIPIGDNADFGKIAPRSDVNTYILCFVPNKWDEIKIGYNNYDDHNKSWFTYQNKKDEK